VLNLFRTLIYPSSGAYDYPVELPHWSYCSRFDMCSSFIVVVLEWYPCCRLKHNLMCFSLNSRKLLMMDILMSETCWAHKKWNKITSGIKLVFYSSTITMMHGPINIRLANWFISPKWTPELIIHTKQQTLCLKNVLQWSMYRQNNVVHWTHAL